MCNNDLSLKSEYVRIEDLNLVKYMFYTKFDIHEWTQIILSRVDDDMFWLADVKIVINNDLIHKVAWFINNGFNLINEKSVKKIVKKNLKTKLDGRNMKVDPIQDKGVKLLTKILGYKLNHGSRVNLVPIGFIHTTYVMVVERRKVNLCDIVRVHLLDNIVKIKKAKSY